MNDSLAYLSENLSWIQEKYKGEWIAIKDNKIVAHAESTQDFMKKIKKIHHPFITQIPKEPPVWTTAYSIC